MSRRIRIRKDTQSFFGGPLWYAVCPDGRDRTPNDCTYTIHNSHDEAVSWSSAHIKECHV